MKEAAGEANLTVIAILLIGVIAAIATPLISSIMKNTGRSSCCQSYGFIWKDGKCKDTADNDVTSQIDMDADGNCIYRG